MVTHSVLQVGEATIIAFVFSEIADSTSSTLILYVPFSISTKTGIAPFWTIGFTVVGKPAATVITSSPCLILRFPKLSDVNDEKAIRLADDPELTSREELTPRYFEN